jgi:hypothetical protein
LFSSRLPDPAIQFLPSSTTGNEKQQPFGDKMIKTGAQISIHVLEGLQIVEAKN